MLTKKRKDTIKTHLKNISEMGMSELGQFDRNLQEVKPEMDAEVFKWVNKGVVIQLAYLHDIDTKSGGAMAVSAEFRGDDIK